MNMICHVIFVDEEKHYLLRYCIAFGRCRSRSITSVDVNILVYIMLIKVLFMELFSDLILNRHIDLKTE